MKFKFWFLIFIFSYLSTSSQTSQGLKAEIIQLLQDQHLSGAVWSMVYDGGEIMSDGFGFKNFTTKEPLSFTNKVNVGSVSKTILAAGFLRMATLGLIKLDDPVKKYLPDLPIINEWSNTNSVTLRHLLDHTSGLTDAKLWHIFSTKASPKTPLEAVYADIPQILKIQSRPGSIHSYSNLGYNILGMVIEKIGGMPYELFLELHLLRPLGMQNSSFEFISQTIDLKLAYGHLDKGIPVTAMPMFLRSAGQLTTTPTDIAKFLRFMMSDGTINDKVFIKSEFLRSVGKPKQTEAYKKGITSGYALGAYSRDRYGIVGIAKNGNTLGFTAMIYMFPKENKAFFIAFNMDSETANYDTFYNVLAKHLNLTTAQIIERSQIVERHLKKWNGYYVPTITKVEPFGLLDIVFSHTKVKVLDKSALLKPIQANEVNLLYQGNNQFSAKDRTNISHVFYRNEAGDLMISDGIKTFHKVHGFKIWGVFFSILLGIIAAFYFLISVIIDVFNPNSTLKFKPHYWVCIPLIILILSIVCICFQPFMKIGDKTTGNILLYIGTLLLPVFSIVSLLLILRTKNNTWRNVQFWGLISVLQLCVLLFVNKLLPITMWQ